MRKSAAAVTVFALVTASIAVLHADRQIGRSVEDAPKLSGMFTIHNHTSRIIYYKVRWGNEGWQSVALPSGMKKNHLHPLDENGRAPQPFILFKSKTNGRRLKEYSLFYNKVGYTGYGPGGYLTKSNDYTFKPSSDGASRDLYGR